jgi:hypothetical protein
MGAYGLLLCNTHVGLPGIALYSMLNSHLQHHMHDTMNCCPTVCSMMGCRCVFPGFAKANGCVYPFGQVPVTRMADYEVFMPQAFHFPTNCPAKRLDVGLHGVHKVTSGGFHHSTLFYFHFDDFFEFEFAEYTVQLDEIQNEELFA